ncbi:MAG: hypothetical protein ACI9KE_003939 [Polyangiales bacterium]|jgi:hypothetical protein
MSIVMGGCLAIRDVDDFVEDPACDLNLPLRNFVIHARETVTQQRADRQLFTIRMIRELTGPSGTSRTREAVAVFDPLPGPDVDVFLPNVGVPALDENVRPLSLEFFADLNRNGELDIPDLDHSWIEPHLCSATGIPFVHNVDFLELEEARPLPLTLRVVAEPGEESEWLHTVEVRVIRATPLGGVEGVTRAFFRRARWTFQRDSIGGAPIPTDEEQAAIVMAGVLSDSEDVFVTVFIDRNDDGDVDAGEDYVLEQTLEPTGDCPRSPELCSTNAAGELEIRVPLLNTEGVPRTNDIPLERWWTLPE